MRSETPVADGAKGAVVGRAKAVERLATQGPPQPARVVEGVKRGWNMFDFVSGGGMDRVNASDVAQVGAAAGRDAVANSTVVEAVQKAPQAARTTAKATRVASTMSDSGKDQLREAGRDLAKNKAVEAGSSVATGTGLAWGMRGVAAAIPPLGPWGVGAKAVLTGGSYAVQGAGMLKAAYTAADFADRVDDARDQSRLTGAAIDDVMSRRGNDPAK